MNRHRRWITRIGGESSMPARVGDAAFRFAAKCLRILWHIVAALIIAAGVAHAATYTYDAQGRLVAVTSNSGASARYTYDAMGNLIGVSTIPAGQLAIFALNPDRGAIGMQVTIAGQGFATTTTSDVVQFNGTAAPVSSATATDLTVTVPAGATTGIVTVTVGTASASSPGPFTVEASGPPPVITGFSPSIVTAGSTVTVTGQNFLPVPGQTEVSVGAQVVTPTSLTNQQIIFPVASSMGSGAITVETPDGSALSSSSLTVTPSGIAPSAIAAQAAIGVGQSQSLSIGSAGQYGLLSFQAARGNWLSFQMDAFAPASASLNYWVYDPNERLVTTGTVSATSPSIHLPELLFDGSYTIMFQPVNSGSTSITVRLESDLGLAAAANPSQVPAVESGLNESRRLIYTVDSNPEPLILNFTSLSLGAPIGVQLHIAGENNNIYVIGNSISNAGSVILPVLTPGQYEIDLTPNTGASLSVQVALQNVSIMTVNEPSLPMSTSYSGQSVIEAFMASAGENLEFALSNSTATNSNQSLDLNVFDANLGYAGSATCIQSEANGTCVAQLSNLAGGTYFAEVVPGDNGVTGTFNTTATLTQDQTASLSINVPFDISLPRPGSALRATFAGVAGQPLDLAETNITAGQTLNVDVYNPDGSLNSSSQPFQNSTLNELSLPQTGEYTVYAQYQYGLPGSATLELLPPVSGSLALGSTTNFQTSEQGQNIILTFEAAAGQNLELALSSITSTTGTLQLTVYDSAGSYVSGQECQQDAYYDNACVVSLWDLSGGTYTVVLSPGEEADLISADVTLTQDAVQSVAVNQPIPVQLDVPGQLQRLEFNGTAGEPLDIAISNVSTNPSGFAIGVSLLAPNGTQIDSDSYDISSAGALHEVALPQTGTYTILVQNNYGVIGTSTIEAIAPGSAPISVDGASLNESTSIAGEAEYLRFSATAGENLEFALSNASESEPNPGISINLYDSSGNYINGAGCLFDGEVGNPCMMSMWDLAAGNYILEVYPNGNNGNASGYGTESFTATLTQDLTGSITTGQVVSVDLARPGNLERLTFAGTAGSSPTVTVSNLTTSPAGHSVDVAVYDPTGALVTAGEFNASGSLSLGSLSLTGNYQIIVYGNNGVPATLQVGLQ